MGSSRALAGTLAGLVMVVVVWSSCGRTKPLPGATGSGGALGSGGKTATGGGSVVGSGGGGLATGGGPGTGSGGVVGSGGGSGTGSGGLAATDGGSDVGAGGVIATGGAGGLGASGGAGTGGVGGRGSVSTGGRGAATGGKGVTDAGADAVRDPDCTFNNPVCGLESEGYQCWLKATPPCQMCIGGSRTRKPEEILVPTTVRCTCTSGQMLCEGLSPVPTMPTTSIGDCHLDLPLTCAQAVGWFVDDFCKEPAPCTP